MRMEAFMLFRNPFYLALNRKGDCRDLIDTADVISWEERSAATVYEFSKRTTNVGAASARSVPFASIGAEAL
jgi:hypothetical protein